MASLPDPNLANTLARSLWPKIKVATQYLYLGILIGTDIDAPKIFLKAYQKTYRRLLQFIPTLRILPLHKRCAVVNIYILSVMSYVSSFYVAPDRMVKELMGAIHRIIDPFRGSAIPLILYHKGLPALSFRPALRCFWADNLSSLVPFCNFASLNPDSAPPRYITFLPMEDHSKGAAQEFAKFLSFHSGRDLADVYEELPSLPKKKVYSLLVESYYQRRSMADWDLKLRTFYSFSCLSPISSVIYNLSTYSPSKTPDYTFSFFIPFLRNALPTSVRTRFFSKTSSTTVTPTLHPCPFCRTGTDDYRHFLKDCLPIAKAILALAPTSHLDLLRVPPPPPSTDPIPLPSLFRSAPQRQAEVDNRSFLPFTGPFTRARANQGYLPLYLCPFPTPHDLEDSFSSDPSASPISFPSPDPLLDSFFDIPSPGLSLSPSPTPSSAPSSPLSPPRL